MTREDIITVMNTYYAAFNSQDKAGVLAVFSDDCDFVDLTMGRDMKGLSQVSDFIDETWRLSPYFRLEPEEIMVDGAHVAVRLFMSGAAKVDAYGKPKPGHLWRIPSTSFFRLKDGQIYWKADCWNMLSIPKQIGWLKTLPKLIKSNRRPQ